MRRASPMTTEIAQLTDDEHVYSLAEQARLRCERFRDHAGTDGERVALDQIHRELGMAGWLAGSHMPSARRLLILAAARRSARTPMLHPDHAHALAAVVIQGEDAVATALAGDAESDTMHAARSHLLRAMELLATLV